MWMLVLTGSTAAVSIQRPQVFRVTGRVWACASHVDHRVCWEPVVLHYWGADIWSFFTHWGVEENHHGPGQEQQNPLRVLLCFVCTSHHKWSLGCLSFVSSSLEDSLTTGLLADWWFAAITFLKVRELVLGKNGVYDHLVLIRVPLFLQILHKGRHWGFCEVHQWDDSGWSACSCRLRLGISRRPPMGSRKKWGPGLLLHINLQWVL